MKKSDLRKEIYFKKGRLRKRVYESLNKPKTATEIAKEIGAHRSAVSRALLDLEREGLAKCVNPEDKSFRHVCRVRVHWNRSSKTYKKFRGCFCR